LAAHHSTATTITTVHWTEIVSWTEPSVSFISYIVARRRVVGNWIIIKDWRTSRGRWSKDLIIVKWCGN
jgi:hypothetical protein